MAGKKSYLIYFIFKFLFLFNILNIFFDYLINIYNVV